MSAGAYAAFLASKAQLATASGFDCSPDEVHPLLKPHQRDAVAWAVRGGRLPVKFMLLQPPSWHPEVWTDVARMRTLNMMQERKGQEQHLCPMPFDLVDRLIQRYTMPGETVYDPFGGLFTVPYCAVKLGRQAVSSELSEHYFRDGVAYVRAAAAEVAAPTLFDLLGGDAA